MTAATDARTATETELTAARDELIRLRVALAAGVPTAQVSAVASRLVGATEAELAADAKTVVALFGLDRPDPAVDPSQGRGHDDPAPALTPQAAFAQAIRDQVEALKR